MKKILKTIINRLQDRIYRSLDKNVLSASRLMQKQIAEFVGSKDFQKDYEDLIRGMAKEDIQTLSLMFARLQESYLSGCRKIFSLTQEEHERLDFIRTCFKPFRLSMGGGGMKYGVMMATSFRKTILKLGFFLIIMAFINLKICKK